MTREEAIRRIKAWNLESDDMEVLAAAIPELRESEDERIRKFLVKHVSEWIGCIEHDLKISSKDVESEEELAMFKAGLAYLENQNHEGKKWITPAELNRLETLRYEAGFDAGVRSEMEKQKEQKPKEPDWCHHKVDLSGCSEEYMKAYYDGWNNCNQQHSQCKAEQKPAEKQDYSGLNDLERAVLRGFLAAGVENVSVTIIKETAKECLAQMKPQEWSEEDSVILDCAVEVVEKAGLPSLAASIKSLRPQPHTISTKDATKFGNLEYERGVKDGIQSEKSHQWKPSEEQMWALKCAVEDIAKFSKRGGRQVEFENEPYYMALHSLYCNLEKLM